MARHTLECNETAARHGSWPCMCEACICEGWCTEDELVKISRLLYR